MARERGTRRGGVTFVEDEIDDPEHRVEPVGQIGTGRHLIGDLRVADLSLGSYDPLGQRRCRREKRSRDLLRRQAADLAKRQGDLGVRRQRRVTAGEDEAEAIVFDALRVLQRGLLRRSVELRCKGPERGVEARSPAEHVDGFEASR